MMPAIGHADNIVDLDFTAGAHTGAAGNAGIQIDRNRRVGDVVQSVIGDRACFRVLMLARQALASRNPHTPGPLPEFGFGIRALLLRLHIRCKHLEDHCAGFFGTLGFGADHHVRCRLANAGCSQYALAFDFDHAGAAIAVRPVARLVEMAKMRNALAFALRNFPNGFAGIGGNLLSVEGELDGLRHDQCPECDWCSAP